jgi:hypothetical protein
MKTFSINAENNITVCASTEASPHNPGIEAFTSSHALGELAAHWPGSRRVEIWNTQPGVTPVKKFTDRGMAVGRIWKAIQSLGEVAPPADQPNATPVVGKPQQTEIAPAEAAANDDVIPATATTPAADGKLLRMLARVFEGLSPEQPELKWDVLKKIVATPKAPASSDDAVRFWLPPPGPPEKQLLDLGAAASRS